MKDETISCIHSYLKQKRATKSNVRKTPSGYKKELRITKPHIRVLDDYYNASSKLSYYCIIHDVLWQTSPISIKNGYGCKLCAQERVRRARTKTTEQYICELKEKNPNIIVVDSYVDSLTPITHKCLIDGYTWKARPANVLMGTGCPKCAKNIALTHMEYVQKVAEISPNIEVCDSFVNMRTPILHFCKVHGIAWKPYPYAILSGQGCAICGNDKISSALKKTHEQYVKELLNINPDLRPLEEYQGSEIPILHECLIDNYQWKVAPANLLHGHGCPRCNCSRGEKTIERWLQASNIEYIPQYRFDDCRDKKPLPFDFYLPQQHVCIEYDGEQHYRSVDLFGGAQGFAIRQKHDALKTNYCLTHNIPLLRISYQDNIEETLNNFLINISPLCHESA